MGTILVSILLVVIVAGIIATMIRDRKNGKSFCGGNCAHCKGCAAGCRPYGWGEKKGKAPTVNDEA